MSERINNARFTKRVTQIPRIAHRSHTMDSRKSNDYRTRIHTSERNSQSVTNINIDRRGALSTNRRAPICQRFMKSHDNGGLVTDTSE